MALISCSWDEGHDHQTIKYQTISWVVREGGTYDLVGKYFGGKSFM